MQSKTISGLKNWVNFFNKAEIPVLKLTSNELFLLLQQEKNPSARSVANIIKRESNTLGSKSLDVEVSKISVELKVLIEQMREQVQNIE